VGKGRAKLRGKNDKEASLLRSSQILGRCYLRDGGQKSEDSSESAKLKDRAKVIGQRVLMSAGIGNSPALRPIWEFAVHLDVR
jgi:hypothetical protein